ncbi:mitochondrial sodium/calcium exchanger protein-like isoform X2 [Xenia sp. Carnegie-2017]|uniref:mitochondrial sodium/calcium exchanger protein-like isoform X2 n=1 Tax=Xenia sp. Carnegie-2017 TaxID=2897299 RepID=UPI001F03626D|nr:mitochondrial sodium/calcium exchanger protein-like isoform X2 [Xenia sp. Carnegie-2017]
MRLFMHSFLCKATFGKNTEIFALCRPRTIKPGWLRRYICSPIFQMNKLMDVKHIGITRTQDITMISTQNAKRRPINRYEVATIHNWKYSMIVMAFFFLLCLFETKQFLRPVRSLDVQSKQYMTRKLLRESSDEVKACVDVHKKNRSLQCMFVKTTNDCISRQGFIQYLRFPYCDLPNFQVLAGLIMGVTFLAYGNGSPDIFTAVAAFSGSNPDGELALGALLGAGLFVTTVVVGGISLSVPVNLNQRPYIRDTLFYIAAVFGTFIIVWMKKITITNAIGYIVGYVIYVLVVVVGRVVYQRYKLKRRQRFFIQAFQNKFQEDPSQSLATVEKSGTSEEKFEKATYADESTPLLVKVNTPFKSERQKLFQDIFLISPSDFVDSGALRKIYSIVKMPIHLCLNLTIPVVRLNEENENWNKKLRILQCLCCPLFCVYVTKGNSLSFGENFPFPVFVVIISVILAVIVAITSSNDQPPRYHKFFSFMAFVASVIWIYSTVNEIVNLLRSFGVLLKLSDDILGVTLLAWGNSIGDFISNIAVAKQGYPEMAIAACFGGPLLNLLLGLGLSSIIFTLKNNAALVINTTTKDLILCAFLATSLASSAVIVPLMGFRIPRLYGAYLILLYISFMIVAILDELEILF